MILQLLDRVAAPLVVTLHTILSHPDADQRRVMEAILRRASRIIVMTEKGRTLLEQVHGVNPSRVAVRSEEHTSELQSLMRISYAVFCLKKKTYNTNKKSIQP